MSGDPEEENARTSRKGNPHSLPMRARRLALRLSAHVRRNIKTCRQSSVRYWHWFRDKERRLARFLRKFFFAFIGQSAVLLLFTLFGLNAPANSSPIVAIIQQYQTVSVILSVILILYIIRVLRAKGETEQEQDKQLDQGKKRQKKPLYVVNIISYTISLLFLCMIPLILIQPPWCPTFLCRTPQLTNPQGVHDANLDAYFFTFEGNAVVIPGNPALASATEISNEKNPYTVHAVLLKDGNVSSPTYYRIVLVVHSLYQGRYSILIDQVALVVDNLPIIPKPLNVWVRKPNVSYDVSRYGIVYHGETRGSILFAKYLQSANGGFTQLAASESDQLDVQISSLVPVDLKFKMKITYHIATMCETYTLTLPGTFEVVFSDKSNWHEFDIHAGHFVANL